VSAYVCGTSFAFFGGSMNAKHGVIGGIDPQYIELQKREG
jgi:hypothetical protein